MTNGSASVIDTTNIPTYVQEHVKRALATLKATYDAFDKARRMDVRFGGQGRYEWEVWETIIERDLPAMRQALANLAEFREHAPGHGVDADQFIAALGGVPDVLPHSWAVGFITDDGKHPLPAKFAAYLKEFIDDRT